MLTLGALSLFVGLTLDPFWLVMGSPAILTLVVYVGVRVTLYLGGGVSHCETDEHPPPSNPDDEHTSR